MTKPVTDIDYIWSSKITYTQPGANVILFACITLIETAYH